MMKKPFRYWVAYFLVTFMLVTLVGGQAFACLIPSPMEIREDRAMACCTEYCRMETTEEAAREACQLSRTVTGQEEVMTQSSITVTKTGMEEQTDTGLYGWVEQAVLNPLPKTYFVTHDVAAASWRPVDLYLLTHSLRI